MTDASLQHYNVDEWLQADLPRNPGLGFHFTKHLAGGQCGGRRGAKVAVWIVGAETGAAVIRRVRACSHFAMSRMRCIPNVGILT
ncbi:MAG: hypothetical protein KDK08_03385 [Rhizobiaceae bacterium]|nr:hypothetical protein [Rhizobiaceae bacterium]